MGYGDNITKFRVRWSHKTGTTVLGTVEAAGLTDAATKVFALVECDTTKTVEVASYGFTDRKDGHGNFARVFEYLPPTPAVGIVREVRGA